MGEAPGELAALVLGAREARGWSRYAVATRAYLAEKTLREIEVGRRRRYRRHTLARLAMALGVPLADLEAAAVRDAARAEGGDGRVAG